jgi:hypothetical protein
MVSYDATCISNDDTIRYVLVFLLLHISSGDSLYILHLLYMYIYEPLTLR